MKTEDWKYLVLEALSRGVDPDDIIKLGKAYGGRK